MPAIPLLSRGFSSGLLAGSALLSASSLLDSDKPGSGDSNVASYTVIGFFAVVVLCIVVGTVYRCTRPCRRARKAQRATNEDTPARQATKRYRANRDYLRGRERERQAIEAALIIQTSLIVPEPTRYNRGHLSVRPTATSTIGSSAEVQLALPEPAVHRTRPTNAPNADSRPSTPLPKYARHDPLQRVEGMAELHPREGSPNYTERNSLSPNVEPESS